MFEGLPAGLVAVWGSSARDVWVAGGDDGTGPLVLRFDGDGWQRLSTGASGDLWWIHGFADGPVWLAGEGGLILRHAEGQLERMDTPGPGTVFGVWGSRPDDLWAVGGMGQGFIWRFDGSEWRALGVPAEAAGAALYKVWGTAADDVWIVGEEGMLLHYDGSALVRVPSGTSSTLFTLHGAAGRVAAVGGFGSGVIVERDGGDYADVAPPRTPALIGVWLTERGGYAVGDGAMVLRREAGGWAEDHPRPSQVVATLHSVWVDPDGGVWAAGGQVRSLPLTDGVLLHRGPPVPTELPEP